ncbi:DUF397 domain-containing protein [Streptomyces sp. PSKA54]|uniref:DUF397 domain-containing protein n=1 Tax=Streptomyces himalayensis subsp. aureolus TaxID=2758039 RepID=A0A7W2D6A4_9ACTN|nr:DUF397 domain-containing protein [Streptomyces himalayensis]MBA4865549.1 DUF397 domain-containing protein [Streptomyces himalayensis subsp. aureolus]
MPQHASWQKSSYCGQGESCVHVAACAGTVHITESSDPSRSILAATPRAFCALIHTLKLKETRTRG